PTPSPGSTASSTNPTRANPPDFFDPSVRHAGFLFRIVLQSPHHEVAVTNAVDRIDEIFWEAGQRTPGAERDAYLARVCGAAADLRRRVAQLLRVQPKVDAFLERPFAGPAATADLPAVGEGPGSVLGPYKLLEQIGEGGMGLVFMAEQTQPVR